MRRIRPALVTAAAACAAAIGGGAIANAASSGTTSSTTSTAAAPAPGHAAPPWSASRGGHTVNGKTETLLTGDVSAKVRAAALAKVTGSVERVETNVDDSVPYEAHIVKSDGTAVIVEVNGDFTVASVNTMPMGPGH